MVYKVMEEQHKMDSSLLRSQQFWKMKGILMNLLCSYAVPMAYQNVIRKAVPLTFLR